MYKKLLLICIPILVFVSLEYKNLSLFIATNIGDMRYYIGRNEAVERYDEAVLLIQEQKYLEAKALLEPLLNNKSIANPQDVHELYGDLIYVTHGSQEDVLFFYEKSLSYTPSLRVQEKITSIRTGQDVKKPIQDTQPTSREEAIDTGATLRASRRMEIVSSGITEKDALNLYGNRAQESDIISRTLDLLETGSSIPKDW